MGREAALGHKMPQTPSTEGLKRDALMKGETFQDSWAPTAVNPALLANRGRHRDQHGLCTFYVTGGKVDNAH